jgi:hypothetical protein
MRLGRIGELARRAFAQRAACDLIDHMITPLRVSAQLLTESREVHKYSRQSID